MSMSVKLLLSVTNNSSSTSHSLAAPSLPHCHQEKQLKSLCACTHIHIQYTVLLQLNDSEWSVSDALALKLCCCGRAMPFQFYRARRTPFYLVSV